ncbi:trichohyalin [Hyalella azteca]|uniref:Trichohyalin n=1 Tax=Hyalella azteca TaxID=294128 RepID=A0A8B7NWZ1_HYAAZ|nr:trichohyalin [Hyalella azteca]
MQPTPALPLAFSCRENFMKRTRKVSSNSDCCCSFPENNNCIDILLDVHSPRTINDPNGDIRRDIIACNRSHSSRDLNYTSHELEFSCSEALTFNPANTGCDMSHKTEPEWRSKPLLLSYVYRNFYKHRPETRFLYNFNLFIISFLIFISLNLVTTNSEEILTLSRNPSQLIFNINNTSALHDGHRNRNASAKVNISELYFLHPFSSHDDRSKISLHRMDHVLDYENDEYTHEKHLVRRSGRDVSSKHNSLRSHHRKRRLHEDHRRRGDLWPHGNHRPYAIYGLQMPRTNHEHLEPQEHQELHDSDEINELHEVDGYQGPYTSHQNQGTSEIRRNRNNYNSREREGLFESRRLRKEHPVPVAEEVAKAPPGKHFTWKSTWQQGKKISVLSIEPDGQRDRRSLAARLQAQGLHRPRHMATTHDQDLNGNPHMKITSPSHLHDRNSGTTPGDGRAQSSVSEQRGLRSNHKRKQKGENRPQKLGSHLDSTKGDYELTSEYNEQDANYSPRDATLQAQDTLDRRSRNSQNAQESSFLLKQKKISLPSSDQKNEFNYKKQLGSQELTAGLEFEKNLLEREIQRLEDLDEDRKVIEKDLEAIEEDLEEILNRERRSSVNRRERILRRRERRKLRREERKRRRKMRERERRRKNPLAGLDNNGSIDNSDADVAVDETTAIRNELAEAERRKLRSDRRRRRIAQRRARRRERRMQRRLRKRKKMWNSSSESNMVIDIVQFEQDSTNMLLGHNACQYRDLMLCARETGLVSHSASSVYSLQTEPRCMQRKNFLECMERQRNDSSHCSSSTKALGDLKSLRKHLRSAMFSNSSCLIAASIHG